MYQIGCRRSGETLGVGSAEPIQPRVQGILLENYRKLHLHTTFANDMTKYNYVDTSSSKISKYSQINPT